MKHVVTFSATKVGNRGFKDLDYADDIALPVTHPTDLSTTLTG